MSNQNYYQTPPQFDPSKLDEDHEIRFYYDDKGHLTRIRKERRMDGCVTTFFVWGILGLLTVFFFFG